jgi:hypothetical protein
VCFLTAVLGFGLFQPLGPNAQAAVITIGSQTVSAGETANISLTVEGFTGVIGYSFSLTWDPTVIQYVSSVRGLDVPDLGLTPTVNHITNPLDSPERLSLLWDGTSLGLTGVTASDGATLFTLNFKAIGEPGSSAEIEFWGDSVVTHGLPSPFDSELSGFGTINIQAVPEPPNWVACLMGGVFASGGTFRWYLRQRRK